MNLDDIADAMFGGLARYGDILALVSNSLWAGAILGLVGGLIGVFVMQRDMAFAVHGISELSFAGAAAALLIGADGITEQDEQIDIGMQAQVPASVSAERHDCYWRGRRLRIEVQLPQQRIDAVGVSLE